MNETIGSLVVWPLRFAVAKGGRQFHIVEYDGSVPMGVRGGAALCGAAPGQWKQVSRGYLQPHENPWYTCDRCTLIARRRRGES